MHGGEKILRFSTEIAIILSGKRFETGPKLLWITNKEVIGSGTVSEFRRLLPRLQATG